MPSLALYDAELSVSVCDALRVRAHVLYLGEAQLHDRQGVWARRQRRHQVRSLAGVPNRLKADQRVLAQRGHHAVCVVNDVTVLVFRLERDGLVTLAVDA